MNNGGQQVYPRVNANADYSEAAFSFLISEIFQYCHSRVYSVAELEDELHALGYGVGDRVYESICLREKFVRREKSIVKLLSFINTVVWRQLFGKQAELLEKVQSTEEESYMVSDTSLIVNRYVSVPKDLGALNCGAFAAGIVQSILYQAGFSADVTAHAVEKKGTTILIKMIH